MATGETDRESSARVQEASWSILLTVGGCFEETIRTRLQEELYAVEW